MFVELSHRITAFFLVAHVNPEPKQLRLAVTEVGRLYIEKMKTLTNESDLTTDAIMEHCMDVLVDPAIFYARLDASIANLSELDLFKLRKLIVLLDTLADPSEAYSKYVSALANR